MSVKYKERDHSLTLSNVGDYWSQAKAKAECIMEAPTKALFFVDDLLNRKKDSFEMDLTGFPERPEKTTRIEVDFSYISEDRFEIVVRDLGFGELFKSSGKEVRKVYQLQLTRYLIDKNSYESIDALYNPYGKAVLYKRNQ